MKAHLGRHIRSALILSAPLFPAALPAQGFPPDAELELMLRYVVEDTGTPGIVLGVLEADGSTRIVSYGSAGPGAHPLGPASGFQIASITKTFTASLLAEMAGRGEVALDDPVAKFLPDHVTVPVGGNREITLLDLATHRSGLPSWPDNLPLRGSDPLADFTIEDLYAFLSSHELRGVPGTGYLYSNLGYGLLGHALARAAGTSYRDLVGERIFAALGMDGTHIAVPGEPASWMAMGHIRGETVPFWHATEALQGAGSAVSNVEDLLTFLQANVGPATSELGRAMRIAQEVRITDGQRGAGWGFSWRTGAFPDGALIRGHGGEAGGFKSRIAFSPERQVGVVVLANEVHLVDDLETMLLYLGPPFPEWGDVSVDPTALARYVGTYRGEEGAETFFVRLEAEGLLTLQSSNRARERLYARSDTTFYTLRRPVTHHLSFERGGGGHHHRGSTGREEPERRADDEHRSQVERGYSSGCDGGRIRRQRDYRDWSAAALGPTRLAPAPRIRGGGRTGLDQTCRVSSPQGPRPVVRPRRAREAVEEACLLRADRPPTHQIPARCACSREW
jgi:serine-type D-Ala-D-Ala carboxypeptidase/endopeptidase